MADLYRKSSIDKLSNPEQLDKTITITSPFSWLALLGVLLIIVSTVVWAFTGKLAETTTLNGIVVSPQSTGVVYADEIGVITKVEKNPGDKIEKGDVICEIKTAEGKNKKIVADEAGIITHILVSVESQVYAGAEIVRYTPSTYNSQIVICYVPAALAETLKEDMDISLYCTSVDSQKYGHMEGTIVKIGEYPVSASNMWFVLGNDNLVANQFLANGPVVAVTCEIKKDSSTKSGYYWTNENGENLTVSNGSYVSAKVVISEDKPITKLIGILKDKLEG